MNKVELLEYREAFNEIKQLKNRIDSLYSSLMFPRNTVLTGMPSTHNNDPIGKAYERIDEMLCEYRKKIDELIAKQKRIEKAIDRLPPKERQVMKLKYIDGYSWNKIAYTMHYSQKHVYKIHCNALRLLSKEDTL